MKLLFCIQIQRISEERLCCTLCGLIYGLVIMSVVNRISNHGVALLFAVAARLDKYIATKNSCWTLTGLILLKHSISRRFLSSLYLLSTTYRRRYNSENFSDGICSGIRFVTKYSVLPFSSRK